MRIGFFCKKILFLIFVVFTLQNGYAQDITGSLHTYLNEWLSELPDSMGDDYIQPTSDQLINWNQTVDKILGQDIEDARVLANTFNYQITRYADTIGISEKHYFILEEKKPRIYHWGLFVFNKSPCRAQLIIQAPHPIKDYNTGKEAIYCFSKLNAKSLFISGTNRCNHSAFSLCDGTTQVCADTSSAYRISDMAHAVNTAFQGTTERLIIENELATFVQLHGFNKKDTDPFLILSNGNRDIPAVDYATRFRDEIALLDTSLTFKIAHIDTSWNRLIGFTNTQGRLINGSANPCDSPAASSNGRFLHVEQEKSKLRLDVLGWHKVYMALANSFECNVVADQNIRNEPLIIYPNPLLGDKLMINPLDNHITQVQLLDMLGNIIVNESYSSTVQLVLDMKDVAPGMYLLVVLGDSLIHFEKVIRY